MPTTQQQSKVFNAKRFAMLLAGFDIGNPSDEEALSKGRALRRMAVNFNLRIVDLLEMPDVKKAVDEQMQPARQYSRELKEALEQAATLRASLAAEQETTAELRRELAAAQSAGNQAAPPPARVSHGGLIGGGLVAMVAVIVITLLVVSAHHSENLKGEKTNELGNHKREGVALVRKSGGLLPVSKLHAVPHRVRSGGASSDVQPIR